MDSTDWATVYYIYSMCKIQADMLVKNVMYVSKVDVVMLLSLDIHGIIAFSKRTSHGVAFDTYAIGAMDGIGSNQVGLWY